MSTFYGNRTARKAYRSTINTPKICIIAPKIFSSAVRETEMIGDPNRKPHRDDGDGERRQKEALDEALKNTFPASDPVSVEQPTTSGRVCRS
jgi:hypothetical protein